MTKKKIIIISLLIITVFISVFIIINKYYNRFNDNGIIINGIKYVYNDKTKSYSVDSIVDENQLNIIINNTVNDYPVTRINNKFLNIDKELNSNNNVNLYNVFIPSNIERIDDLCFSNIKMKIEFELNSKLKYIGKSCFTNCIIDNVKLPEGLLYINMYAFNDSVIDNLSIPNSIKDIDSNFKNLETNYNEFDGLRYLGNNDNPYMVLKDIIDKDIVECNIEDGAKIILTAAFAEARKLEKVNIPSSVSIIKGTAFLYCNNLKEVKISLGVKYIERHAFSGSNGLTIILEHSDIPKTFNHFWIDGENYSIIMNNEEVTL